MFGRAGAAELAELRECDVELRSLCKLCTVPKKFFPKRLVPRRLGKVSKSQGLRPHVRPSAIGLRPQVKGSRTQALRAQISGGTPSRPPIKVVGSCPHTALYRSQASSPSICGITITFSSVSSGPVAWFGLPVTVYT